MQYILIIFFPSPTPPRLPAPPYLHVLLLSKKHFKTNIYIVN